ncbi:unnamed protein product [Moneuplotes crassus]|uniref:O-acyltransferase WSD1 C-terminal domain-containing protein n=2 Tax=Euplotes crassus TaxID=5936 RepID=A0AAD1XEH8_EUPCR|nr:unnamed protein product [Moneuplotes crassus]
MFIEYGLLHALVILLKIHFFGVLPTVAILAAGFWALAKVLDKCGYQFTVGQDLVFFFSSGHESANCVGYIEMEKVKAKTLKHECFYKKAILNVRKLRQVPVTFLGVQLWKDVTPEVALEQFRIIDNKFESDDDVIKPCNEWAKTNISMDKPQWELQFKEDHTETTSLLFLKCHHSFTDGVGIITLFALLNDDSLCPKMMPKFKEFSYLQAFMLIAFTPISLICQAAVVWFHKVEESSRMLHTPTGRLSDEAVYLKTKTFNFKDVRKCYKQFDNTTFNNYVMGVLSKSLHSWFHKNGVEPPKELVMSCPVSMKTLPKSVSDIDLNNYTSSVTMEFPVCESLSESIKITRERFSRFAKFHHLIPTVYFQKLFKYIPRKIGSLLYNNFVKEMDFLLTNVNGPREPIYLCNKQILSITPFLSTFSSLSLVVVCFSYNQKVSFQIIADKQLQMDPADLKEFLETYFDSRVIKLKNEHI